MTISRFPARTFPRAYARFDRLLTLWDRLAELFHDRTNPRRSVRLGVEGLEDRVVPAGGWPDLNPVFFVGSGEGTGGTVKAYRSDTGDLVFAESVYDAAFLGGVHVAAGDVTGDGFPDLITAPSSGGGPRIQVLEGHTGKPIVGPLSSFWAFDSSFRGGVSVAAADMDADGIADVIAAAGPGGGPRVQVFSGATGMTIVDFFAFDADFRGGVSVAVADVDGDGTVDIIAGAGPGGGPRVRIFSGATGMTIADFFAFDADFRGGVTVAAGDLNGDRKAEVAVGVGRGGGPQVKVFNPLTATVIAGPLGCYFAFDPSDRTGVLLNADGLSRDLDGDGVSDLVVNTGAGIPARSRVFSGASGTAIANFDPSGNGDGVRAALIHMASGQTTGSSEATSEELQPEVNAEPAIPSDYGVNPMRFEANVGQTDSQVRFLARGDGYSLFLTSTEAVLSLGAANPPIAGNGTSKASVPGAVLRFQLLGAANAPQVVGVGRLPGVSNYLRGNDPAHWLTDVPNYAAVSYQEVYPGIDVIYHGNGERLEYDFTVAPGADPSVIRFRIQGTEGVALDAKGNLVLHTAVGDVLEHAPVLYQGEGANRQAVSGGYVLNEDGTVGFIVGSYDAARALVIDPVLAYSTYLGGSGAFTPGTNSDLFAKEYENAPAGSSFSLRSGATGKAIAVDGKGNAYVTGAVWTSAFPFTASVVQPKFTTSGNDAYVTMLDPAGRIVFSTYLGGNPDVTGASDVDVEFPDGVFKRRVGEQYASSTGTGIAVDDKGNVYVTGSTLKRADDGYSGKYIGFESPTLPLVNPFQSEYGGGPSDAFVAKLNPTGTALIYSSYYGGELLDEGTGIAADAAGNAYVVGTTISGNYTDNAFVLKINPVGAKVYEQVFGLDRTFTSGNAIAADAKGNVYFIGETTAAGLGTPLAEALGDHDVIVGRLNPAGKVLGLIRLGGNRNDFGTGIALDAHNNVYLTGTTISANFPTTAQAFQKDKPRLSFGVLSAFVTKLSSDLTRIIYSTYLGGTKGVNLVLGAGTAPRESPFGDAGYAIAVDSAGAAYVVGGTDAANFPSLNAAQKAHAPVPTNAVSGTVFAQNDAFVAKLDATGSNLVYSSYLGGSGQDVAFGVAVDNLGNAYVVGTTDSADLRTTVGAVQENFDPPALQYSFDPASFGHQTSAFVVRLAPPIRVFAHPIQAYLGEAFVGIPASFVSPDRDATPSDFSVSIDWGDGLEYLATVEIGDADSNLFLVRGFHVYFDRGAFPVVVTVHDLKHDTYATTADVVGAGGAYQGNATIVTDPSDPDRVFIAGSELVDAHTPALFLGTSDSRGLTWTTHVRPDDTVDLPAGGDSAPAAAADQYGNIFLAYLTNDPDHAAVVAVSTDGGATFSKLYTIPGESGTPVRPAIAVGPGINGLGASVWVAAQVGDNITVVGAPVGGLGDVGDFVLRPGVAPEPDAAAPLLGDIAIGPDGNVAVSYHVQGSAGPSAIYVLTLPGSLTPANEDHETAKAADTQLGIAVSIPAQSERAFPAGARLAWDTSTGPHRGRLYLVYTDAAAPDDVDTDIILRVSDDRGRTWGERSRLNDDNGAASQFLPSIAVDPSNGDVAVGWYDARYDPNGENLQVLYAITVLGSGDADIPSKNVTASVYFSDANRTDPNPVSPILQFGDISGIAFSGGIIHAVWADNSAGLRGATGTQNDFSIAAAAIPVAHVTVPPPVVTGVPWTFTEGTLLTGTVATFTEADPFLNSDSFSATIDWGDGSSPTTGVVFLAADGEKFNVNGTHLYTSPGAYVLTVTVVDTANGLLTSTLSNVSRASGYQADGSVAVDPTNADRLFAVSVDRTTVTGSYSSDGGLTWNRVPIGEEVGGTPELLTAPRAVFDRYGNLFVAFLRPGSSEASVLLSTDGGQSFQPAGTFLGADLLGSVGLAVGPGRNADEEIIWITYRVGEHDIAAAGAAVVGPGGGAPRRA